MKALIALLVFFIFSFISNVFAEGLAGIYVVVEAEKPQVPLDFPHSGDENRDCIYIRDICGESSHNIPLNGDVQEEDPCSPDDPDCCLSTDIRFENRQMTAISENNSSKTADWFSGMQFLMGTKLHYKSQVVGHQPTDGTLQVRFQFRESGGRWNDGVMGTQGAVDYQYGLPNKPQRYRLEYRTQATVTCPGTAPETFSGAGMAASGLPQYRGVRLHKTGDYYGGELHRRFKDCHQENIQTTVGEIKTHVASWQVGGEVGATFKFPQALVAGTVSLEGKVNVQRVLTTQDSRSQSQMNSLSFDPDKKFWVVFTERRTDFDVEGLKRDFVYHLESEGTVGTASIYYIETIHENESNCSEQGGN